MFQKVRAPLAAVKKACRFISFQVPVRVVDRGIYEDGKTQNALPVSWSSLKMVIIIIILNLN